VSAEARPSAAEMGGLVASPDYDTTQHVHSKKKAKRSGQAERSGEGKFWGLPQLRHITALPRAEEDQAECSGQAERIGEGKFWGLPQLRHNAGRAEESQA
jgi:hypothetical protein